MPYGYTGKILHVNLSTGSFGIEETDELFRRYFFGGWGFILHYLFKEMDPSADPLGPDNVLVFSTGPITGAPISGSGRHAVGAKSPLTGGFGASEAGGFWGAELKRAGFDAIVIKGKAPSPVYLWLHNGQVEIREASHLWGKTTAEVQELLHQELGDRSIKIAQIGPAGENLVRYACITHDLRHFAGRCGLGAVMGSKNLRAIAVKGEGKLEVADPDRLANIRQWLSKNDEALLAGFRHTGTAGILPYLNAAGGLPTRNFTRGHFEGADEISGQKMAETILVDRGSCYACIVRCKRVVEVREGPYPVDPVYGGPEYETIAALGSSCGISDLKAIARANQLCGAYGLDTISAGVTIAFAMECGEKGLLKSDEVDLRFGDPETLLKLLEMIAFRRGLGDLLAEGVRRAAGKIGPEAYPLAMEIKGQEIPMHEPRFKQALGLGYAISPTGADHNHNVHDDGYVKETRSAFRKARALGVLEPLPRNDLGPGKVRLFFYELLWQIGYELWGLCRFLPYDKHQVCEILQAVTGWDVSIWEMMKAGQRIYTLARIFNIKAGFSPSDDRLPERFFEPFVDGPLAGEAINPEAFQKAKELLYGMMGWDPQTGMPYPHTLAELDIKFNL
ncbi:MAG: aldehyde ferredoxin oxidoreductase family protein [Anaerolineae bacterium]|nr:aldehyde ferredoxin oxidoreductase family protein [Anaerolineae bacterium]MDW8102078.1 aldehyde ferredoxin oxidoreductase family protein [Anaerolineae bacterium]